ncbi:uncharacterized protein LOC144651243 [Oculina patagonica]
MYKPVVFILVISCLVVTSLPCGQNWSSLARCLRMGSNTTSSDDILQFVRRYGYMIVPQSNPPTQGQGTRVRRAPSKRAIYTGKCPYQIQVEDFIDTVPRFLSNATCSGCDVRCKPVTYTLRLLRRKCGDYWLWEEHDVQVAFVLEQ